jgi:hypothetical protein
MLINVAFEGNKLFKWEGDADAIAKIDQEVVRIAKLGDVEPEVLGLSMLFNVGQEGFSSANPDAEMMFVIWMLISLPTGLPNHPGYYRDYIGAWDFDFDIKLNQEARTFDVSITGDFAAEGTA